jgi:hypothetical protein
MRTLFVAITLVLTSSSTMSAGDWLLTEKVQTTTNANLKYRLKVYVTQNYQDHEFATSGFVYIGSIPDDPYPGMTTYRHRLAEITYTNLDEDIVAVFGVVQQSPTDENNWTNTSAVYYFTKLP